MKFHLITLETPASNGVGPTPLGQHLAHLLLPNFPEAHTKAADACRNTTAARAHLHQAAVLVPGRWTNPALHHSNTANHCVLYTQHTVVYTANDPLQADSSLVACKHACPAPAVLNHGRTCTQTPSCCAALAQAVCRETSTRHAPYTNKTF